MNSFLRVIRSSLQFRWSILAVVFSSIVLALFWCVNIGTVYPFVLIVVEGKSMHDWIDESITETRQDLKVSTAKIARLKREVAQDGSTELSSQLLVAQQKQQSAQWSLSCYEWIEPSLKRYVPEKPMPTLILLSAFLFIGTLIKTVFLVMNKVFVARVSQRTAMQIRNNLYERILETELSVFRKDHSAGLISNFSADVNAIASGLNVIFGKSLREPFKMAGCMILAALISWRLLLFSLLICPLPMFLMYFLAKSIKRASRRMLEQTSEFYERLSETFRAIHIVKAFTMESSERHRFVQATNLLYRRLLRIVSYDALSRGNNEILAVCVICLAFIAGGYLVLDGQTTVLGVQLMDRRMSPELLFLFFGFLVGMSDPARKLADVVTHWQRAAAGADRVCYWLDREPTIRSPSQAKSIPSPPYSIEFDEVTFQYQPEIPLLEKFNLRITSGETLAIVGPNGCGKTTLANLITRFYDPLKGEVRLNGVDVRELQLSDLRERVGYVTQQAVLFRESVVDNISYGSPQASRDQIFEAARKAFAHDFITKSLEDGYETVVGEQGGRLSGGQRQRIALARAILRDPDILLLDEATSQVDLESEQLIHRTVKQFIQDRTTIIITHRASTLSLADRILVMELGRIVDLGTHVELVERCELYGRLYRSELKKTA